MEHDENTKTSLKFQLHSKMRKYMLYGILLLYSCGSPKNLDKTTNISDSIIHSKKLDMREDEKITIRWYVGDSVIPSNNIPFYITPLSDELPKDLPKQKVKSGYIIIEKSKSQTNTVENKKITSKISTKKKTKAKSNDNSKQKIEIAIISCIFAIIFLICIKNRSSLKKNLASIWKF